jgi:hypothetical protein
VDSLVGAVDCLFGLLGLLVREIVGLISSAPPFLRELPELECATWSPHKRRVTSLDLLLFWFAPLFSSHRWRLLCGLSACKGPLSSFRAACLCYHGSVPGTHYEQPQLGTLLTRAGESYTVEKQPDVAADVLRSLPGADSSSLLCRPCRACPNAETACAFVSPCTSGSAFDQSSPCVELPKFDGAASGLASACIPAGRRADPLPNYVAVIMHC